MTRNQLKSISKYFVLSYSRGKEFQAVYPSLDYFLVDNGNQSISSNFKTSSNIGCAGGWNLICSIAFDYYCLDKIIILNDDINLPVFFFDQALEQCSDTSIVGILQPYFEFSAFAITKNTYQTIGKFDENIDKVYGEDADYKQRARLLGISVDSLYMSSRIYNESASSKESLAKNIKYLNKKWGNSINPSAVARADNQPPFKLTKPTIECTHYPSDLEYELFRQSKL